MRLFCSVLALGLAVATASAAQDGAQVFNTCKVCHTAKSTPMAPTLTGVMGAKIAGRTDFNYSQGMRAKGKDGSTWTEASLDAFLAKPTGFAPGTRMVNSVSDPAKRKALIGYLKTLK